ncbi:MAG: DNA translocase FtsK [Bacilli bacterium]
MRCKVGKKKNKRDDKNKKFEYSNELYGVVLILASILGMGGYGPVGDLIKSFTVFLVGGYYAFLIIAMFLLGFYIILKRQFPNLISTKLIGLYIFIIGTLALSHLSYVKLNDGNFILIMQETINDLMGSFKQIMDNVSNVKIMGGGVLGAVFAGGFNYLFDYNGTRIIGIVLIVAGIVMFTGISIFDVIRNTFNKGKGLFKKGKELANNDDKITSSVVVNNAIASDDKIKISDISELTKIPLKTPVEGEVPIDLESHRPYTYKLPSLNILKQPVKSKNNINAASVEANIVTLERVLKDFDIIAKVVEVNIGPTVTQYELELHAGTKVNKLLGIHREISLALAKKDVRIQAPIPGKSTVGIELPNEVTAMVSLREILETIPENKKNSKLLVALGKNIMGNTIYAEIDKTQHLLVAGATGSGKSVCINGMIASILMRTTPEEVRLVLVDPKKVELSVYNGCPHLLAPVVTDPKKASLALLKIVNEMEKRYEIFSDKSVKNIAGYNEMIDKKNQNLANDDKLKRIPYIVVIVDELADLMLVASKEVEDSIMRITQMARAAGIHLIIATQRPSTDVITGLIKANIPSRISFAVSSSIDSRTILDMMGAEKLLGKGDMLFLPMGESAPLRIQGAFVSDEEIKRIVDYTISQQKAEYDEQLINLNATPKEINEDYGEKEEYDDPLYNEIVEFVITTGKASASLIQRKYRLGYNRAARIVDLLEERGIVGPSNGSKPRDVLIQLDKEEE